MSTTPESNPWPFDQPPNCGVFTIRQILDGTQPILHVTHDFDDHGWQFLGWGKALAEDAKLISLAEAVALDGGIMQLADLPPGWHAWRRSITDAWIREPNPNDPNRDA